MKLERMVNIMKKKLFKKCALVFLCITMVFTFMSVLVSANMMKNRMTSRAGTADSDSNGSQNADSYEGNIDSGTDGHIDENSDTGEFGSATENNDITVNDTSSQGPVESVIDGVVTDATNAVDNVGNAVDNATGGSMWGIIIAIVVIGALAAILFAFFTRKK